MQLIIWEPINPVEKVYLRNLRQKLHAAKKRIEGRIVDCLNRVDEVCKDFPEELQKIGKLRRNLRYLSTGIPTTESLDTNVDPLSDLTDTDRHTLKVAYRKAASLAHPDKGGSEEDFLYVRESYANGDLDALREYIVFRIDPDSNMLDYWNQQVGQAEIRWEVFRSTPKFKIAQLHLMGNRKAARAHAEAYLAKAIQDLEIVCFNQGMLRAVQSRMDDLAQSAGKPRT